MSLRSTRPLHALLFVTPLVVAGVMACATGNEQRPAFTADAPDANASASAPPDGGVGDSASDGASKADTGSVPDSGKTSSACSGRYACDPLLDTGCPSGQHCVVSIGATSNTVSCRTVATFHEGDPEPGACPCPSGYACYGSVGVCYKICDPSVGVASSPGVVPNSPGCTNAEGSTCVDVVGGIRGNCFGMCDEIIFP